MSTAHGVPAGDTLGVDRLGNLCLDLGPTAPAPSDDTVSGWRRLLTGVDLDFVRACMATAQVCCSTCLTCCCLYR
jgi:hypothetical protein